MKLCEISSKEAEAKQLLRKVVLKLTELYPMLAWQKGDLDHETGELFNNGLAATWKSKLVIRVYNPFSWTSQIKASPYLVYVPVYDGFRGFLDDNKLGSFVDNFNDLRLTLSKAFKNKVAVS